MQNCRRLPTLRKALESLPETLDETYARILRSIAEEDSEDAIKILQWLTYSAEPLKVEQLAEVVAVKIDGSPWFDCKARFPDQQDVIAICSSLVIIEDFYTNEDGSPSASPFYAVRLAHFSVKEYLVSDRIRNQATATARYAMQEIKANQSIAAACLAYLLQFDQHDSLNSETLEDFPLVLYAARCWMRHTRTVGKDLGPVRMLSLELCQLRREAYINWYRIYDPDEFWNSFDLERNLAKIASPLYYGSLAGVTELVRLLLENGADVNAQEGRYGNALHAASLGGYVAVVQLLLNKGADVNAKGGYYGSALQAASKNGHETVVQLLLKNGADVNAKGGYYGSALQAASSKDDVTVVQLLLNNEADVNAEGGEYGNALQAASYRGHETVVQLLLKKGADVNAEGEKYGTALQAASCYGHEAVVQLLLNKGAEFNTEGGQYGTALQAASCCGHEAVVQLLLNKGAEFNTEGGQYGTALQAASCCVIIALSCYKY